MRRTRAFDKPFIIYTHLFFQYFQNIISILRISMCSKHGVLAVSVGLKKRITGVLLGLDVEMIWLDVPPWCCLARCCRGRAYCHSNPNLKNKLWTHQNFGTASTSKHLWIIETRTIVVKEGVTCHVQDGHKTPQNNSKQLKMPSHHSLTQAFSYFVCGHCNHIQRTKE